MGLEIIVYLATEAVNSYKMEAIVRALKTGSTSVDISTYLKYYCCDVLQCFFSFSLLRI